tara:strand:- start:142877 stop:143413 length:537 start_codon:yes stop_codon:yes gene_type:complete
MKNLNNLKSLPQDASYAHMPSPVGELIVVTSANGLHAILWEDYAKLPEVKSIFAKHSEAPNTNMHQQVCQQLNEYFDGNRKSFDIPIIFDGTVFQNQAWQQLQKIPYGETISYGEQAKRLGDKNKARAVGLANGCNPISIIVPCHRVIGSNGALTGFGGGLTTKAFLLSLEKANLEKT